jgi:AraC-like DNA-binding protein
MLQSLGITVPAMVAGMSFFAAATLWSSRPPWHGRARGLAVFMFITGAAAVEEMLLTTGAHRTLPHLLGIAWPLAMLKGPAIFIYVQSITRSGPPTGRQRSLIAHGWPLLLGTVLAMPFFLLDGAAKAAFMDRGEGALFADRSLAARGALGLIACALVISLAYLVAAFRLLVRHTRRVRDLFSNIEDKSLSWARWVLLILSAAWLWGLAKSGGSVFGMAPEWQEAVASVLELAWVGTLGYFGILQRPVFDAAPAQDQPARYSRSALDAPRMDRIAARLHQAMAEQRLFSDPGLSLRGLSDRLGVSENYISQTLNERLGRNFFDFINAARIEEARRLLRADDRPILEIAMAVGFNSRSTFNAAFRKHAGCSPSEFRAGAPAGALPMPDPARPDTAR